MDTGEYRVEPRDFVGENFAAGGAGPVIEGHRMAEFVVHPHDIDPTLTTGGASTGVSVSTDRILADGAGDLLEPFGMITGFRTSRSTEDESGMLQVAVARFPTPDDAAQAAQVVHDFEQVDRTTPLASDPSGHRNRSDRQGRVERLPHGRSRRGGAPAGRLRRDDPGDVSGPRRGRDGSAEHPRHTLLVG
ncbi:hypothetical protein ACLBYD_12260 [Rhodococcus sp. C26F]